jgi:DNA-binding MltR family transcriptional regulator
MFNDDVNGPISTLAAKIKLGHALGVYAKTLRDDLDLMRHIRNLAAHAKEAVDFSSPEIMEACANLVIPDKFGPFILMVLPRTDLTSAKVRFMESARMAFLYLRDSDAPKPMRFETHPSQAFDD